MAADSMSEQKEFGTEWEEYTLVPLGGKWYFVVGIVKDTRSGERKVRIAKGPMKDPTQKMPSQVQRLNVKSFDEWQRLTSLVEKFCAKLPPRIPYSQRIQRAKPNDEKASETR